MTLSFFFAIYTDAIMKGVYFMDSICKVIKMLIMVCGLILALGMIMFGVLLGIMIV